MRANYLLAIFQFFVQKRGYESPGRKEMLYKKNLIYANLFFTNIGE